MNTLKNQILAISAFILLFVGLSNAASQIDPLNNEIVSQQEIREFAAYCAGGMDPR